MSDMSVLIFDIDAFGIYTNRYRIITIRHRYYSKYIKNEKRKLIGINKQCEKLDIRSSNYEI